MVRYNNNQGSYVTGLGSFQGCLVTLSCENLTHVRLVQRVRTDERVAEWLRRLTRKPKVRMAVGSRLESLQNARGISPASKFLARLYLCR